MTNKKVTCVGMSEYYLEVGAEAGAVQGGGWMGGGCGWGGRW